VSSKRTLQARRFSSSPSCRFTRIRIPKALVNGTEFFRPVIVPRNLVSVSRKLVPIAMSRFARVVGFLGQWMCEGGIRQGVEEEPEARAAAQRPDREGPTRIPGVVR
jgi:hypothetical protein